jgi:pimeloyl-ACP methyl ester carboxylesterase
MAKKSPGKHTQAQCCQSLPPVVDFDIINHWLTAAQGYWTGLSRYCGDFLLPYFISTHYFQQVESKRSQSAPIVDTISAYLELMDNNLELLTRGSKGVFDMLSQYHQLELKDLTAALYQSVWMQDTKPLKAIAKRQADLMELIVETYPRAIGDIGDEYGFHFERGDHPLVAETERFYLYQVMPYQKKTTVKQNAKPILILPPYVLGANILGFLPGEERSYAHCYANLGIPTYIRILKDIQTTEALQQMTGEDDADDTAHFCKTIMERHGKPVTLNGYCQGGYNALCNLLTGRLDDLVDAFITCVSPMDGTRSKDLARFLQRLPKRFNDLAYGTKTLANGNQVADGRLMGWVYKLKSIETESPLATFYRDLLMFARQKGDNSFKISKTAAALNYWLSRERFDLPLEITKISFASYNTPITADGTLPIKLFGNRLNIKRLKEKKIPWLICYGQHDDLVEKETALAPLDYIQAEVTPFPKGHVAIATSWSSPTSACALHTRFGDGPYRGPVRFQLDLDDALDAKR